MSLEITFPAIGFHAGYTPSWHRIEDGYVELFETKECLLIMSKREHGFGRWKNMLMVDGSGRSFRILDLSKDGYVNSFLSRLFLGPLYRLRPQLAEGPPVPFGELVDRVCASIEMDHDGWYNEEISAGEAGPGTARPEDELIAELIARLRAAKDFDGLCDVLADPYNEHTEQV